MRQYYLHDTNLSAFVTAMLKTAPVIAPVAKQSRFVFARLDSPDELRLDYDTTVLPPKKVFFPTKQDLIHFDKDGFTACINPPAQILLGVHPHDIKGIMLSDIFYTDRNVDNNYLAYRRATTIIGTSVQTHYKHAFFGSINADRPVTGHDMFMTRIEGGYAVETLTEKGEALIACGSFTAATEAQIKQAETVNAAAMQNCPEKLNGTADAIRHKVRKSFYSPVWETLSEACFSCGSCNIVCPTCYCFDVQDEWNLDGVSGKRYRLWDACLTKEFSEVSSPVGAENFRKERSERYRHRFMRKAAYLNDQLGGPACIGCGRCSGACTADIANPATVINKLMEL